MAVNYKAFDQEKTGLAPSVEVKDFYSREMLYVARNNTVLYPFASRKALPAGNSKTIRWLRDNTLENLGELEEMTPPVGQTPTEDSVITSVKLYGDIVKVSDEVQLTYKNDQLKRWQRELQKAVYQTKDALAESVLTTPSNLWAFSTTPDSDVDTTYDGSTYSDITSAPTPTGLKYVVQQLRNNLAPEITDTSMTSDLTNTQGIFSGYVMVIPRQAWSTITGLTGFVGIQDYPKDNAIKWSSGEIGAFPEIGLRVVVSDNMELITDSADSGTDTDAYPFVFMGEEAFGAVDIDGGSMKNYIHPVNEADKSDPLAQMGIVGVKFWDAYTILNQDFIVCVHGLL